MEDRTESPIAVKVEEHARCVILTYFQGDINTMVDAHFSRALGKVCKVKSPEARAKKIRKPIKREDMSACQSSAFSTYTEAQDLPGPSRPPGHLVALGPTNDDAHGSWHSLSARAGEAAGLPSIAYSLSTEGLSLTGQQYATSLLNLLHSDRTDVSPSMASNPKPELVPSWTMAPGFRESVDPAVGFETDRRLDKKDLYWY